MREDWNSRARKDAKYYVAFGRRAQNDDEFFDSGAEMVSSIEAELKRLPEFTNPHARRALEIGCGPGRLMRPLSRHFGEIHGVDVSDEMVRLARENLAGIPHAHVHHTPDSNLAAFADESFDLVYSYAVFQHIPKREVVFGYLKEARRVLKTGGIARLQFNGLPESAARYDTWSGVRVSAGDLAEFARSNEFQLLALEGLATQYLWLTIAKQPPGWYEKLRGSPAATAATIRRVTNAFSSEPLAPITGRFASISLWLEDLPLEAGILHLDLLVGGTRAFLTYIGPRERDGLQQVNAYLPAGLSTGLCPLELRWHGKPLTLPYHLRLIPPGPAVPRIESVSDGIDLLSGNKIVTGTIKVVLEEAAKPEEFRASLGGRSVEDYDIFCTDPRVPKHEINFDVPAGVTKGRNFLNASLGRRRFAALELEIA
jgi:ubiquinone/menaquinone biosynthesis C-methylase UbiE